MSTVNFFNFGHIKVKNINFGHTKISNPVATCKVVRTCPQKSRLARNPTI
jgi:hypothetical protein